MRTRYKLFDKFAKEKNELRNALAKQYLHSKGEKKIYVIDDCRNALLLVNHYLKDYKNVSISLFENELDAIPCILDQAPDLIILDINLKVIDGIKLSQMIESISSFKIPIVYMSQYNHVENKLRDTFGQVSFLPKPIHKNHFISTVTQATKNFRRIVA